MRPRLSRTRAWFACAAMALAMMLLCPLARADDAVAPVPGPVPTPMPTPTPVPTAKAPEALQDLPSYGEALIRMVVILITMLIVLLLAARFLPRWLNKSLKTGKGGAIKVLDSLQLEPRKRLYLVQVGEQVFLVGTSEQGVQLLADRALDSGAMLDKLRGEGGEADGAAVAGADGADDAAMRSFADVLRANPGAGGAPTKTGA